MDPTDLKILSKELKNSWKSIGRVNYGPTRSEKNQLNRKGQFILINLLIKIKKLLKKI